MSLITRIQDFINSLEERDLYLYMAGFAAAYLLLFGVVVYLHSSRMNRLSTDLARIEAQRSQTKKILANFKAVNQQQAHVEDILAENKNFRIAEAYQNIINRLNLNVNQPEQPTPLTGETVSGKTEVLLNAHLDRISMKQLTDLLTEIANVAQMYPKDLVIKKTPNSQTVDVDLTIATLEPSTLSE